MAGETSRVPMSEQIEYKTKIKIDEQKKLLGEFK